jgi:peptide-methionine (S)-S-oxide reductase
MSATPPFTETATLAGGCFWCLEAVYLDVHGVLSVESGYTGGHDPQPSYEDICTGTTGHAEAVRISFDPATVSYRDLLEIFFAIHDPTTLNRQGADHGTQYRSAIFYHSEQQRAAAQAIIGELTAAHADADPIVTELAPAPEFHPAEPYHQNYYANHNAQPYCLFVVAPKVTKFRAKFAALRKPGA